LLIFFEENFHHDDISGGECLTGDIVCASGHAAVVDIITLVAIDFVIVDVVVYL
jgi:hypothetical protein